MQGEQVLRRQTRLSFTACNLPLHQKADETCPFLEWVKSCSKVSTRSQFILQVPILNRFLNQKKNIELLFITVLPKKLFHGFFLLLSVTSIFVASKIPPNVVVVWKCINQVSGPSMSKSVDAATSSFAAASWDCSYVYIVYQLLITTHPSLPVVHLFF